MKFFHLSDLHLGKRIYEFSMLEDQEHILQEIINLAEVHKPDAVLIAGDVYDKSTPGIEALNLFDDFITRLNELDIVVFITSGNHDSAERMAFAAEMLKRSNIHIVPPYDGEIAPIVLADEYGEINFWLLPYLRPSLVRRHFPEREIGTYTEALSVALEGAELNFSSRNVLVGHQFVTGARTGGSEELYVGGSENVDGSVFEGFDYVALGHLHRAQRVGRETMRYCGAPLKYSLSELDHEKSIVMVEIEAKESEIKMELLPLKPLREMRTLKGLYKDIMRRENYSGTNTDDYVYIVLTDEHTELDAFAKLRMIYPRLMHLEYDNKRTRAAGVVDFPLETESRSPLDLFGDLFELQNGREMNEEQARYVNSLLGEILDEGVSG